MSEEKTGQGDRPKLGVKRINEMSLAYQQAGILWAAIELELFSRVSEGAEDLPGIAAALEMRPDVTDRFLTVCTALGLL